MHGPSFYDWLQTSEASDWLKHDPVLLIERDKVDPDTYTPRALYRAYLTRAADHIVNAAGPNLSIRRVSQRATAIDRDIRRISTSDSARWAYGYVALAPGHLGAQPIWREKRRLSATQDKNFLYVPTGDATLQTSTKLASKQRVLLLGLGLTFFGYLKLLTTYLGSKYVRTEDGLRFDPLGRGTASIRQLPPRCPLPRARC